MIHQSHWTRKTLNWFAKWESRGNRKKRGRVVVHTTFVHPKIYHYG